MEVTYVLFVNISTAFLYSSNLLFTLLISCLYTSSNIHLFLHEKYKTVKKEIVNLENSVTSVTPTINEINRLLKGYGFTNFQIQEVKDNKNHYQIVRENGETAKTID